MSSKLLESDHIGKEEPEGLSDKPSRHKSILYVTIEPVVFSVLFTTVFAENVIINLLETVACVQDLGLGEENCTHPLSDHVELLVQPKTVFIYSCVTIVQAVVPSILSLFIGPWSDQNGRKPFLLISLTGFTLSYAAWGLLSNLRSLPLGFYLLPIFVLGLSGGMVAFNTCSTCFIADISTKKDRAFRLTVMSSVSLLGTVSGYLISAEVFFLSTTYGYSFIFYIAAGICFVALLYTAFFVAESIPIEKDRDRNLLNPKFVKEILLCVLEKRPGYSRLIPILLIVICFFMNYLIQGESSIKFLTLKKAFGWTLELFNYFSAVTQTVCVATSVTGIYLLRKLFSMPDLWIAVLAATVWSTSDVLLTFSMTSHSFWAYSLLGSFAALFGPTITAEISKNVPRNDLGKVLVLKSTLESVAPFAAPPVYAALYTAIYVHNPLSIYLLSASFAALLGILSLVVILLKRFLVRERIQNEEEGLSKKSDPVASTPLVFKDDYNIQTKVDLAATT